MLVLLNQPYSVLPSLLLPPLFPIVGRTPFTPAHCSPARTIFLGSSHVLLPGYTVLRSVNSYTDDMWVYHNRAHMSVNGGQRCVGLFAEACSTGKHDGSTGKADVVTPTRWFSLLITCPICCSVYCHFTAKTS